MFPHPPFISDSQESEALDKLAVSKYGMSGLVLMENAGHSVFWHILRAFPEYAETRGKNILVLAGPGQNGGDGWVLARLFHNIGHNVMCWLVKTPERELSGDALANFNIVKALEIPVALYEKEDDPLPDLARTDLVIDAVFGTGLHREVEGPYTRLLSLVRFSVSDLPFKTVAVDLPSGISASTGDSLGLVIPANLTVSLGTLKRGLFQNDGLNYSGRIELGDIGLSPLTPEEAGVKGILPEPRFLKAFLPPRPRDGHKGCFGHAVVAGGSPGKSGALTLAALGALRSGCGLVTACPPEGLLNLLEAKLTSSMTFKLTETPKNGVLGAKAADELLEFLEDKDSLAIGPGLGLSDSSALFLKKVMEKADLPVVLDADALTHISRSPEILKDSHAQRVLTPHPGEAARLLGITPQEVQDDRFKAALEIAEAYNAVVVLKGLYTISMHYSGSFAVNPTGSSILSAGGSGDLLTGLIAGLLARDMDPLNASMLAAWIHGRAAEIAESHLGPYGVSPTEVQPFIPRAWEELEKA
jgi:NAD(P)H-hydrate epimerase